MEKEQGLFRSMIDNGIAKGVFDPDQGSLLPAIHQMLFQGVDYCHLCDSYDAMGINPESFRDDVVRFITNTLVKKTE